DLICDPLASKSLVRHELENMHESARTAIGRGTWREMCLTTRRAGKPEECDPLRIKDLRHLSAIACAMAGADRTNRPLPRSLEDSRSLVERKRAASDLTAISFLYSVQASATVDGIA